MLCNKFIIKSLLYYIRFEASRGAGAQMCDFIRDWSWVQSLLEEIKYLFKFII